MRKMRSCALEELRKRAAVAGGVNPSTGDRMGKGDVGAEVSSLLAALEAKEAVRRRQREMFRMHLPQKCGEISKRAEAVDDGRGRRPVQCESVTLCGGRERCLPAGGV